MSCSCAAEIEWRLLHRSPFIRVPRPSGALRYTTVDGRDLNRFATAGIACFGFRRSGESKALDSGNLLFNRAFLIR